MDEEEEDGAVARCLVVLCVYMYCSKVNTRFVDASVCSATRFGSATCSLQCMRVQRRGGCICRRLDCG